MNINSTSIPFSLIRNKHLYFHWRSDHHSRLQEVVIEGRRMVVQVQHRHEHLSQAVLSLCILCLHIKVVLGSHLSIQARPRLGVDDPRCGLDQKPVAEMQFLTFKFTYYRVSNLLTCSMYF